MTTIGIPRESREGETRVGMTPGGVRQLTAAGHQVFVERGAGERAGFTDLLYMEAGAQLVYSPEEAYWRSELIVKVARPTDSELELLKDGTTLLSFLHLASARVSKIELLLRKRILAIALETIETDDGDLPLIHTMSQIGGRMLPGIAARYLEIGAGGNGVLLSGVPGVAPAEAVVIGAGVFGREAALALSRAGASVHVLDNDVSRLAALERQSPNGNLVLMLAHPDNIARALRFADVLVTAAAVRGERAPVLIDEEQVRTMRPGSLIVDAAIDQGGNVATSRPTFHSDPVFRHLGVTHYCVPNMPAAVGRTATHALVNRTLGLVELIARDGADAAIERQPALGRGVWTRDGALVYRARPSTGRGEW